MKSLRFDGIVATIIVVLIIVGCHKEKTPETGLIGSWQIVSIDSVYLHSAWSEYIEVMKKFPETGEITFSSDSSGYFDKSLRQITCGELNFIWSKDGVDSVSLEGRTYLKLVFSNGESNPSFYYQSDADSIEFFFQAFCYGLHGGVGPVKFYKFSLIRD